MPQFLPKRSTAAEEGGFALLLALFGGLVLLLSSLSVQTTALQARTSDHRLLLRRQHDDAIWSAAQLIGARLQQHRCLLRLPVESWTSPAAQSCITEAERQDLLRGRLPHSNAALGEYEVLDYSLAAVDDPALLGGDLELEWRPAAGGRLRRRIRLALMAGADPEAPLLLRGVRP